MDLVLLESFLAVADSGTITEAADRIHVSQSALSRRLQQLETDLGAELLVRGRYGVELTGLGRQTVERGRAILAGYQDLRRNISDHVGLRSGTVRVGGGATMTSFVLPPAIAAFQARHPGVRFYVREAGSREIAAEVASGDLDLGLVTLPVASRHVAIVDLFVDDIVLVARSDHPLAGHGVTVGDLHGHPFVAFESGTAIRRIIDGALAVAGIEVDVIMELRSIPSMLRMVAATGAMAFVSRVSLAGEADVASIPVRGLNISRSVGLARHPTVPLSPGANSFAAHLAATAPRATVGR